MRPPNPVPIPDARMIPARCLQLPPMGRRHSSLSSMPTVNHCLIGVLFFSPSKYFKELTGTPNPMAPPDLIVSMAMTSPDWFITGLPLLPASMGMATWIIGRPSPNSSSRTAETTPLLMLNPYPRGLPMDRIVSPSLIWSELPREMGCRSALSTLNRARSLLRSIPRISVGLQIVPSANSTWNSRWSPITWKFVAITPFCPTTNPVPTPQEDPPLLVVEIVTTDGLIFEASLEKGSGPSPLDIVAKTKRMKKR